MSHDNLKAQLLNLEPYPEDLKMRIRRELAETRERPLKTWERWLIGAGGLGLVIVIPYKLSLLGREGLIESAPAWRLSLFGGFILLGFCGLAYIVQTARRGTVRPLDGHYVLYGATALVAGKVLTEVYLHGAVSGPGVVAGLVVAGALVLTRLEVVEARLRERQLQTELRLAELAEALAVRKES